MNAETKIAATITGTSDVRPTAVMTESIEKTASTATICSNTTVSPVLTCVARVASVCFNQDQSSVELFINRKLPPKIMINSRPVKDISEIEISGFVRDMTHEIEKTRAIRVITAKLIPQFLAILRLCSGSLSQSTEINTTLSTPRMISRTSRVAKIAKISGYRKRSNIGYCS